MQKQKKDSFELLSTFNRVESYHWWWEGRRYLLKELLKGRTAQKILDVGCGTGETLTYLQKTYLNADLYGLDTSNDSVLFSKRRGHKNIEKANAQDIPHGKNTFDCILFLDVLEHIKDDTKTLIEAKRVLKPGGIIIVTSPALNFLWSDHDKNQGHFRRYNKKDFKRLSQETNLYIERIGYFNFFLSPIIIVVRLLGKIPFLQFIVQYDNGINYEVAHHSFINTILTSIFKTELWFISKGIRYPFGISLFVVLKKDK